MGSFDETSSQLTTPEAMEGERGQAQANGEAEFPPAGAVDKRLCDELAGLRNKIGKYTLINDEELLSLMDELEPPAPLPDDPMSLEPLIDLFKLEDMQGQIDRGFRQVMRGGKFARNYNEQVVERLNKELEACKTIQLDENFLGLTKKQFLNAPFLMNYQDLYNETYRKLEDNNGHGSQMDEIIIKQEESEEMIITPELDTPPKSPNEALELEGDSEDEGDRPIIRISNNIFEAEEPLQGPFLRPTPAKRKMPDLIPHPSFSSPKAKKSRSPNKNSPGPAYLETSTATTYSTMGKPLSAHGKARNLAGQFDQPRFHNAVNSQTASSVYKAIRPRMIQGKGGARSFMIPRGLLPPNQPFLISGAQSTESLAAMGIHLSGPSGSPRFIAPRKSPGFSQPPESLPFSMEQTHQSPIAPQVILTEGETPALPRIINIAGGGPKNVTNSAITKILSPLYHDDLVLIGQNLLQRRVLEWADYYVCEECGLTFPTTHDVRFREHYLLKHGDELDAVYKNEPIPKVRAGVWHKCRVCNAVLLNNLEDHRYRCNQALTLNTMYIKANVAEELHKRIACGICERTFESRRSLRNHITISHEFISSFVLVDPYFRCAICLEKFDNCPTLTMHIKSCSLRQSRPPVLKMEFIILEIGREILFCGVCSDRHLSIEETQKCYSKKKLIRCLFCLFTTNNRPQFFKHMEAFHGKNAQGVSCPFCRTGSERQHVRDIFLHVINDHYIPVMKNHDRLPMPPKSSAPSNTGERESPNVVQQVLPKLPPPPPGSIQFFAKPEGSPLPAQVIQAPVSSSLASSKPKPPPGSSPQHIIISPSTAANFGINFDSIPKPKGMTQIIRIPSSGVSGGPAGTVFRPIFIKRGAPGTPGLGAGTPRLPKNYQLIPSWKFQQMKQQGQDGQGRPVQIVSIQGSTTGAVVSTASSSTTSGTSTGAGSSVTASPQGSPSLLDNAETEELDLEDPEPLLDPILNL